MFFIEKIKIIKKECPLLEVGLPSYLFVDMKIIMPVVCTAVLDTLHLFLVLFCRVLFIHSGCAPKF